MGVTTSSRWVMTMSHSQCGLMVKDRYDMARSTVYIISPYHVVRGLRLGRSGRLSFPAFGFLLAHSLQSSGSGVH